jgi:hypothetical protein
VNIVGVRELAYRCHAGQLDQEGTPYVEHLEAAWRMPETPGTRHQQMSAPLRRLIGQSNTDLDQLADLGCRRRLIEMIDG